jgi:hypothetical protein
MKSTRTFLNRSIELTKGVSFEEFGWSLFADVILTDSRKAHEIRPNIPEKIDRASELAKSLYEYFRARSLEAARLRTLHRSTHARTHDENVEKQHGSSLPPPQARHTMTRRRDPPCTLRLSPATPPSPA